MHKHCLRNGAPLVSQVSLFSRLASSKIREVFSPLPLFPIGRCFIRVIHPSMLCYMMRTANLDDLICDLMCVELNKFDRSYSYCVRNIHIRRCVSHRCRWGAKLWITSGNRLLFWSQNGQLMFPIAMHCEEQRATTFITHVNNLAHSMACVYQKNNFIINSY
jgi:hypothetical protein